MIPAETMIAAPSRSVVELDTTRDPIRAGRTANTLMLAAAVAVPLLGILLSVTDGQHVAFPGVETMPIPPLCVSRWLGFDCPTCGLTRSVIALMHGDLNQSVQFHRFGWLIFLLILAQIPYRLTRIALPEKRLPLLEQAGFGLTAATAGLVIFNWFAEIALAS